VGFKRGLPRTIRCRYITEMIKLNQTQCQETISNREVPTDVTTSNSKVAVIFTQSWCVDWIIMRRYVKKLDIPDVSVYYIEYDKETFYEKMRQFKETVFNNWSVPYVRYFRDGRLVGTSNLLYLKRTFLKQFER
jgi:hypothetical protein